VLRELQAREWAEALARYHDDGVALAIDDDDVSASDA
jgi:hypothetical protein